jgi:hypothetical protein
VTTANVRGVADPLLLQPHGLEFDELDALRLYLARIMSHVNGSLLYFYDARSAWFAHVVDPKTGVARPPGKASTATCLAFLRRSGEIDRPPWSAPMAALRKKVVKAKWTSSGLPENNPFTTAFLLEATYALTGGRDGLNVDERRIIRKHLTSLRRAIHAHEGGLRIIPHPANAFLTHKAVAALAQWGDLDAATRAIVHEWAWNHLHQESVLASSRNSDADVFEIAYSCLIASLVTPRETMTPQQRDVLRYGLDQFFEAQDSDTGTWPRSRPLFLVSDLGNAYCFDFELLVQMLSDDQLRPMLFTKLPNLRAAAWHLDDTKFPLGTSGIGWASGHHGTTNLAESWPTASVFHYCYELDRMVAEASRRAPFASVGAQYSPPAPHDAGRVATLGTAFLDSPIKKASGDTLPLRGVVEDCFLGPLVAHRNEVEEGRGFPDDVPVSAIFYGPPGTSKTKLAQLVADALEWPLLTLDPSHLTGEGLSGLHAVANRIFTMLLSCEQIVVLLDEFDELVRNREEEQGQLESRFLTTAMLPKLAALRERRRIVYILATNHVEHFDAAIRRPGRFDMIIPVMPPTVAAKTDRWPLLDDRLEELKSSKSQEAVGEALEKLSELTYNETVRLVQRLQDRRSSFGKVLNEEYERATLNQDLHGGGKWRDRIEHEASRILIP